MFTSETYIQRRQRLAETLKSGLIVFPAHTDLSMNYPSNTYAFRQSSSFLYFFGIDLPDLVVLMDIDEQRCILFGDELTMDDIVWTGPMMRLEERALLSGIGETQPLNAVSGYIQRKRQKGAPIHYLPQTRMENTWALSEWLGIPPAQVNAQASESLIRVVVSLRSVKSREELKEMELAASIGYEMHLSVMKSALPGVLEQQLAGRIEGMALSGGRGVSFPVILSQRGEVLHGHDHSRILETGRLLLCDAGAESPMHYASDYTRTTPVGGVFDSRQKSIYELVLAANNKAFECIKPGIPYRDIHLKACTVLAEGLRALGLLKGNVEEAVQAGAHALFMPHGLGHMLGLDVHDMEDLGEDWVGYDDEFSRSSQFGLRSLRLGKRLQKGYTLTVEPGLYFMPELMEKWHAQKHLEAFIDYTKARAFVGMGGIRLEDNVLVTENGNQLIGKRLPITVEEVEGLF